MTERSKVNIICRVPNGLRLRLFELAPPDPAGERRALQKGDSVVLSRGFNEGIDAEFWEAWAKQNADSVLVGDGLLRPETQEERDRREKQKEFI